MTDFDPDAFLASAQTDGALDTRVVPIPEGTYRAQITKREIEHISGESKKTGKPFSAVKCRLTWEILDDAVRAELDREQVTVRQEFFIDTDENGAFDSGKGKNIGLGRVRDALGINDQPGNPFDGLEGGVALIKVTQRSNPEDPEQKFNDVKKVAALV